MTAPQHRPLSMVEDLFSDVEMAKFIASLAVRASPKEVAGPPWSWPNLTLSEITQFDVALDQFVASYNYVHVAAIEEVIPGCWRLHPALAQEIPVQFWAWWSSHINPATTINQANDYYSRVLPQFQQRLATRLLGRAAPNCRKGEHKDMINQEIAAAISFDPRDHAAGWGRSENTRALLHGTDFGTQASRS